MQTSDFLALIEEGLRALPLPAVPEGLYSPIAYALDGGGKRMRPMLTLLAHNLYSDDAEAALPIALAFEVYHNHTLLHDDLMDRADVRHGRPSVWRKWDENTAILSGDAMLIESYRLALNFQGPRRDDILSLFARTTREICEGQQYDMNFEKRTDVEMSEYMEMIRLKTSVLPAGALKAGALAADAPATDADRLYRVGEKMGLAFQLQDDLLDCYGDPATFGKRIGGDILCGKKTYLSLLALQKADVATKARLLELLAAGQEEAIAPVLEIYGALNVEHETHDAIEALYAEASAELAAVACPDERKQVLADYLTAILRRNK